MDPHELIHSARLYLCVGEFSGDRLRAALAGGVDVVQLRLKDVEDDEIRRAAEDVRAACTEAGALFILNDRPDLVEDVEADGVHVGQDDMDWMEARMDVGDERLVGVSTHNVSDLAGAYGVDYVGVGPVYATPTKPGREPAGLEYVTQAKGTATMPWFAIGGINLDNVNDVLAAGATRIAVVRAITEADDPEAAARALRAAIDAA